MNFEQLEGLQEIDIINLFDDLNENLVLDVQWGTYCKTNNDKSVSSKCLSSNINYHTGYKFCPLVCNTGHIVFSTEALSHKCDTYCGAGTLDRANLHTWPGPDSYQSGCAFWWRINSVSYASTSENINYARCYRLAR